MSQQTERQIELYLDRVARKIRNAKLRAQVREEIAGHIYEGMEVQLARGKSEEEALAETLRRLGDPAALGKGLSVANRPWYLRWFFLLPVSSGLIALVFVFLVHSWAQEMVANFRDSYRQEEKILGLYLEDQERLAEYDLLQPPKTRAHDAAEFLNSRLAWEGNHAPEEMRHSKFIPEPGFQAISKELTPVTNHGKPWYLVSDQELFRRVDTSWLSQLSRYDHWDLFTFDSPAEKALESGVYAVAIPTPQYKDLQMVAKLRYLRGLYEKNPWPALREVRQLAMLVRSNEILIADMIALGMAKLEREFVGEAEKRGLLHPGSWKTIPEEDFGRARRAIYGTSEWINLMIPNEMMARALESRRPPLGLCSALYESLISLSMIRAYFEPKVWGELNFEQNFSNIYALIEKSKSTCRLTAMTQIFATKYNTTNAGLFVMPDAPWSEQLKWTLLIYSQNIPFVRRYVGAQMHAIARPNFVGRYPRELAGK